MLIKKIFVSFQKEGVWGVLCGLRPHKTPHFPRFEMFQIFGKNRPIQAVFTESIFPLKINQAGKVVENLCLSRLHNKWIRFRPEVTAGGMPPPGVVHWPII